MSIITNHKTLFTKHSLLKNVVFVLPLMFFVVAFAWAGNIDTTDKYAWGENIGWINFGTTEGNVTTALSGGFTGYAWGENVGWISLNCSNASSCATIDYGVTRSGNNLTGYAWGENVGWISFACENTSSCATVDYGVTVNDGTGKFGGYAWGENIGWINFACENDSSCSTVSFRVLTLATLTPIPSATPGSAPPALLAAQAQPPVEPPVSSVAPTSAPSELPSIAPAEPTTGPLGQGPSAAPGGGTGGGGGGGAVPVTALQEIGRQIANQIDRAAQTFFEDIIPAISDTCGQGAAQAAACGVTAATGVATAAGAAAAAAPQQAAAAIRSLPQIIGLKRRPRRWGVVYDASTKRPIPFARIELRDQAGRVLETRFTDSDGRYGFLASPAGLGQQELLVSISVQKDGYRFPSSLVTSTSDYQVYEQVYRGGTLSIKPDTTLNFSIPVDPAAMKAPRRPHILQSLLIGPLADRLLAAGFWVGLILVPVNYYLQPNTRNLVILITFFGINVFRWVAVYRPYGRTLNVLTGKPMPFSLVTLNDSSGQRVGFTVSDEFGRYILPGERGRDYNVTAFTPANIAPQRTTSQRVQGKSYIGKQAWFTFNLRV